MQQQSEWLHADITEHWIKGEVLLCEQYPIEYMTLWDDKLKKKKHPFSLTYPV